jgi:uncharacterized protein (TIGR02231 family)
MADAPVSGNVDIQYLVPNTGWSPTYDLRVSSSAGEATLEMGAIVWQETGEDWEGAKLTLSNVRSELNPTPPSLERYVLAYTEAEKVKTQVRSTHSDTTALTVDKSPGSQQGEEKGIARSFEVPGNQTIRSGLARTKVPVASKPTPYSEHLELVAKQFPYVFHKGELKNPYPWDLDGGPMNVYYNGSFLQQTAFAGVARGSRFGINAGIDHDIRVERAERDTMAGPGLLGSKREYQRVYHTKLENFSNQTKRIKLLDTVPVSEIESVKVALESTLGEGKQEEPDSGWYHWDVKLAPKAEASVDTKVTVACPESFQFSW